MAGPGQIAPRKWDLETLLDLVFFRWGEVAVRGQFAPNFGGEMAVQGQIAPKLDSFSLGGAKWPSEVSSPPTWGRNGRPRSDRPQVGLSFFLGGAKWPSEVSSPPTWGRNGRPRSDRPQVGLSFFLGGAKWPSEVSSPPTLGRNGRPRSDRPQVGLSFFLGGAKWPSEVSSPQTWGQNGRPRSDRPQVGRNGPCRPRTIRPPGAKRSISPPGAKRPSEVSSPPGGETAVRGQFAPGGETAVRGQIAPSFPYWVGFSLNGPLEPSTVSVRTSLGRPFETSTSSLEGPYQTSTASLGGLKGKIIRQGKLFLFLSRSPRNLAGTSVEMRATFLAKKIPSNSSGVGARGDGAKWHAAGRFAPPRNFQSPNISEKRL